MAVPPVGRNFAELVRQVQAFQLVRETEGAEATPAGWTPGDPTLKPGLDATAGHVVAKALTGGSSKNARIRMG